MLADTERSSPTVFYLSALAVPLSLPPALFVWHWPTPGQWGWLVLLGLLAAVNMYGVQRALRIGDASQTTPFDFIRLPCAALVGYHAFAETPEPGTGAWAETEGAGRTERGWESGVSGGLGGSLNKKNMKET